MVVDAVSNRDADFIVDFLESWREAKHFKKRFEKLKNFGLPGSEFFGHDEKSDDGHDISEKSHTFQQTEGVGQNHIRFN
tara:strand:- start:641 stop:877 length:237 start_codon:yes stop_codon:yes gene_type:complete